MIAVRFTAAVVTGLSLIVAAILGASISLLVLLVVNGALIYWLTAVQLNKANELSLHAQQEENIERARNHNELLAGAANGVTEEIESINESNSKIEKLLSKNINNLYTSFAGLNETVKQQQDILLDIIDKVSHSDRPQAKGGVSQKQENLSKIRYFASEMLKAMNYFVQQILETSKDSMTMVHKTEDMLNCMVDVEKLLSDVRTISDQTNLLALNAAIEAARAGDSGRGFAVVADEVRKLSRDSNDFSNQISEVIKNVSSEVGQAKAIAARLASRDMTQAIHSKAHIDDMLKDISEMEDYLSEHIGKASNVSNAIQKNINLAVVSLQFEDLLTQLVNLSKYNTNRISQYSEKVLLPLAEKKTSNDQKVEFESIHQALQTLRNHSGVKAGQTVGSDIDLF